MIQMDWQALLMLSSGAYDRTGIVQCVSHTFCDDAFEAYG